MSIHARREPRHAFHVPARLVGADGRSAVGSTQDLSRRGLRLRLKLDAVCPETPRFAEVLAAIRDAFGKRASVVMSGHALGAGRLLSKEAIVVRLVTAADGPDALDVGLLFLDPLSEEEAAILGAPSTVVVPGDDAPDREETDWDEVARLSLIPRKVPRIVARGVSPGAPSAGRKLIARPKQRHPAVVQSLRAGGTSVSGHTEVLTAEAVLVRLKGAALDEDFEVRPLAAVAASFSELYGERIRLTLGAPEDPVWRGWGRLGGFEAAADSAADVIVMVALERPMDDQARIRAGLDHPG